MSCASASDSTTKQTDLMGQRLNESTYPAPRLCRVGTIDFVETNLDSAVNDAISFALSGHALHIHFANAWSISLAFSDEQLSNAFRLGHNFPDGKPVVWAMQWLCPAATQRGSRVAGPVFFDSVLREGVAKGIRHYFLGSTTETLARMQSNVSHRFPGIQIVGASSPPFKDLTPADLLHELSMIEMADPDIVWVGLGTPKQDTAAAFLSSKHRAVFACVGAAFDFTAGNLKDAPAWMHKYGLGWLFRLCQEPRRLWRRYTYGNLKFIWIVGAQMAKKFTASRTGQINSA